MSGAPRYEANLRDAFRADVLATAVPDAVDFVNAATARQPVEFYRPAGPPPGQFGSWRRSCSGDWPLLDPGLLRQVAAAGRSAGERPPMACAPAGAATED